MLRSRRTWSWSCRLVLVAALFAPPVLAQAEAGASAEESEEEAPAEKTPAEKAPEKASEDAPAETAPAETAPADKAPAATTPADKAPADTAPARAASVSAPSLTRRLGPLGPSGTTTTGRRSTRISRTSWRTAVAPPFELEPRTIAVPRASPSRWPKSPSLDRLMRMAGGRSPLSSSNFGPLAVSIKS